MTAKHTPGPWSVMDRWQTLGWGICIAGERQILARMCGRNKIKRIHNAKLMAAAPDLLAALREISADYADRFDLESPSTNPGIKIVIEQARAAIAKATGGAA